MTNNTENDIRKLCDISLMTVLICVCSWISVPFVVPFTMQTFAVFCALLFLGGKNGTCSIVLYLFTGAVGLPVFSGFGGGIGHLLGPTGGYVIGFVLTGIIYALFEPLTGKSKVFTWLALAIGLIGCYLLGTLWFVKVFGRSAAGCGFMNAIKLCVMPYIIPDCVKMALAVYISGRVKRTGVKTK